MSADVVSIFILPPSMEELRARLHRRAEDDDDVIEQRLANAAIGNRALARI
jgi:guanylate kinase